MSNFFSDAALIKAPPIKRAAYSDRTAWIMAEISRLVYEPLPGEVTIKELVTELKSAVKQGDSDDILEALAKKMVQLQSPVSDYTINILRKANFEFIDSFYVNGTEALIATLNLGDESEGGMIVLAFRGTQPSIKDVITDMKANLVSAPEGGRIHNGFLEAYQNVADQIEIILNKYKELPLYITGHSLGGALALVATRYLGSDSTGATYIYGCPRVADDDFFLSIRTPVYRIVNAADAVARVPFGYGLFIFLSVIRLIPMNGTLWISEWIRRTIGGYTHYGNLVFLSAPRNSTDSKGVSFKGIVAKKSPNIFWRMKVVLSRLIKTFGKAGVNDHRMNEYSQKLLAIAKQRRLQ
jgi:triacylglycerol lipase